jgi:uncharacterized phage protein (TIGR01671 family)
MRELKFRAWDKKQKKMLYGVSIGTIKVWDENAPLISHEFSYSEDCIFEQYTGLKDKNGKEIYEGDIVNLEYYEKPFGKKRWNKTYPRKGGKDINVVGFEDGYFKFYEEDKDGYGSELSFSDYGEWEGKDGAYKYVAEVIGNIHENPELLE